jgi:hypothetical protein
MVDFRPSCGVHGYETQHAGTEQFGQHLNAAAVRAPQHLNLPLNDSAAGTMAGCGKETRAGAQWTADRQHHNVSAGSSEG